jgi:hypothetical protein
LLTLYTTPVIYLAMDKFTRQAKHPRRAPPLPLQAAPAE